MTAASTCWLGGCGGTSRRACPEVRYLVLRVISPDVAAEGLPECFSARRSHRGCPSPRINCTSKRTGCKQWAAALTGASGTESKIASRWADLVDHAGSV